MIARRQLLGMTAGLAFAGTAAGAGAVAQPSGQADRHLPAGRRVGCGGARRRGAVVGQARPDRDRRQQAGRRHDHRRQLRAGGQGRLSHADAVELRAALDRALPVRQAALRPDQGFQPRRLYRLGRQRLRRAACRAGQDHAGADRLDQRPGQAGAVRLGRPGLDRPHHRRDVQGRARPEHGAHRLSRRRADVPGHDGGPARLRRGHADRGAAARQGRQARA